MGLNNIIYLSVGIVALLIVIVGIIILKLTHKSKISKFLGICSMMFVVIFGVIFAIEKPEMEVKEVANIEVKTHQEIPKPNTSYHFQDITDKVRVSGNIDYEKVGEYDIQYEVDTIIGTYTREGKVNVVDTKAPEIILDGEEMYNLSYAKEYEEPGYTAIDDYEGDITDRVVVEKQVVGDMKIIITYEVQDSSGNKAEEIREVTLVDDIPPELTLNGKKNVEIFIGEDYEEEGATAQDEKDGDLTNKIEITGEVDTTEAGKYVLSYKVVDSNGNETTKQRLITVKENEIIEEDEEVEGEQVEVNTQEEKVVEEKKEEEKAIEEEKKVEVKEVQNKEQNTGIIYLTFDDGPSTNITPQILDILKEKNIKATFFILNYDGQKESIVKREYDEGHTVAIHGYSHDYNTIYQSEEAYMENITKLQDKIRKTTGGYNAIITRFPGGSSNMISKFNPGIMTRLTQLVVEKGYRYFDWNVSSEDAAGAKTSEAIYQNVVNGLKESRTNVVLMHDFSSNSKLIEALPKIIDYGLENGYTFERITESTPMLTHRVNN